METFSHPDHLKKELESLLNSVVESNDEQEMDKLYHMITDKSNQLRKKYGIPTTLESTSYQSVLKTPTEQLHAAGIANESILGHVVFSRASAESTDTKGDRICLFDQCFVDESKSDMYRKDVLIHAKKQMPKITEVSIYPPLLARSNKEDVLTLRIDRNGNVSKSRDGNMVFIFSKDGPIIPVMSKIHQGLFKRIVEIMYRLQGYIDSNLLEKAISNI